MRGIPVELSATVALPAVVGDTVVADLSQLQMEHRTPIEVDEIRFGIKPSWADTDAAAEALLGVSLEAGPFRLTSGFVPVWAADPGYNAQYQGDYTNEALSTRIAFSRWILPAPMVLPVGFVLKPQFQWTPDVTTYGLAPGGTVTVSLVGRALIDGKYPRSTRMPYVATWDPRVSASPPYRTQQLDLTNDLDKQIHVHRLVGHALRSQKDLLKSNLNCNPAVYLSKFAIRTSQGAIVTPVPAPMIALFPAQNSAIAVDHKLDRSESYIIEGQYEPNSLYVNPHISLVATREEAI